MKSLTWGLALLSVVVGPAPAQPAPGDWIFTTISTTGGAACAMRPASGSISTIAVGSPLGLLHTVVMAPDNLDVTSASTIGVLQWPFSWLVRITPWGAVSSIAGPFSGGPELLRPQQLDVDQDGAYVLSDEWFNFVRKVDPVTGGVSIVLIAPGRLTNLVIDQDTGDYVIGVATSYGNQSSLLRADRSTGALATIATGLGQVTSIDFEPRSGDFVLGRLAPVSVLRVRRDGSTQALGGIPTDPMALKVDDETGNLLVGGWDVSTARITSLSPAGGVLTSHVLAPPFWIGGVEVYGSRKVFGSGSLTAGSAYAIDFAFPASPGAPYVAALSLALRPGIALRDGVRVVNLAPDPLFFRSLGGIPGITTGFSGTLDATGRARGTITLPPRFPTGIRLFVTAVAANPALPGGLDSGNSIGATSK